MNDNNTPVYDDYDNDEPMIDAKQAAAALRLPYYWFADHSMRTKYRIPHFLLGGLVRYRMSDLSKWAASSRAPQGRDASKAEMTGKRSDEGAE